MSFVFPLLCVHCHINLFLKATILVSLTITASAAVIASSDECCFWSKQYTCSSFYVPLAYNNVTKSNMALFYVGNFTL